MLSNDSNSAETDHLSRPQQSDNEVCMGGEETESEVETTARP